MNGLTPLGRLAAFGLIVVGLAAAFDDAAPRPGEPRLERPLGTLDLEQVDWALDGVQHPASAIIEGFGVSLLQPELGVRWSFVFHTEQPGTARMFLDWFPGPEGLVIELVIDGERLVPARDGWRPTQRQERADLGSRWFGAGDHLVEIVAREGGGGGTQVRSLELRDPTGG